MSNYNDDDDAQYIFGRILLFIVCPFLIPFMPFMIYDDYKNGRTALSIFFSIIFGIIVFFILGVIMWVYWDKIIL